MFYLYFQSSSASRQLKISNLMFFANPVYKVWSHPSAWHLKTFQWHGWTQSSNNSIFSLWNIPIFRWKIFYLHLQASRASRKWKKCQRYPFRWPCTQSAKRSKRDTKKIFTGHYWTRSSNNQTSGSLIFLHISLWRILISTGNISSSFRILKRL